MSGSRDEVVPGWAHALGRGGLQEFLAHVEAYFAGRGIVAHIDALEGVVRPSAQAFERSSLFGLRNLAQSCARAAREAWPDLIATHFDCVFAGSDQDNALRIDASDFEHIRPLLRSRLYPIELLSQSVEIVHRPGPEGTIEVVVIDLPTTVRTVARSEAKAWPLERESLFELARRNLAAGAALEDIAVSVQPGVDLHAYTGDPYYAASHALVFERYAPAPLPHGALVGIPKRDVLLAHFIRNIGAAEAIGALMQIVIGMHADGPGSLSPHLYWYRGGEFITLPYHVDGESLRFTPPGDFVDMLQRLAGSANLS